MELNLSGINLLSVKYFWQYLMTVADWNASMFDCVDKPSDYNISVRVNNCAHNYYVLMCYYVNNNKLFNVV